MTSTSKERQARFREKMREAGFVRVSEWVPKTKADDLRQIAKGMRDEAIDLDSCSVV